MMGSHIAPDCSCVKMEKFVKRSSKPKKGKEVGTSDKQLRANEIELDVDDNLSSQDAFGDDSSPMEEDFSANNFGGPSHSDSLGIGAEVEIKGDTLSRKESNKPDSVTISKSDWEKFQSQNKRILKKLKVLVPEKKDRKSDADSAKRKRPVVDQNDSSDDETPEKPSKRRVLFESSEEEDIDNEFLRLAMHENLNDNQNLDVENDSNDHLAELEEIYLRNTETGPPVSERLARLIDAMATGTKCLTDEKLKEKERIYKRPENIRSLIVPKVNNELWSQLDHSTKSQDLKTQRQQKLLLTAVNALVRTTENLLNKPADQLRKPDQLKKKGGQPDGQDREIFSAVTDATSILLKATHDLSMDRRNRVLSSHNVNNKYKRLVSADIPITEYLFGDNLKEAVAAIDSSSKLGNNFTKSSKGRKFFPGRQSKNYQDRHRNAQWIRGRRRPYGPPQGVPPARGRGRGFPIQKTRFQGA